MATICYSFPNINFTNPRPLHQNAPKCTKMLTITRDSKVFQNCPEWLLLPIFWFKGHLKGDRSQRKSWRSHGVVHELHQNTVSCFSAPHVQSHISHWGQIQNFLVCLAMVTFRVYIGAFWFILVHLKCNPRTLTWLARTPVHLQVSI